MAIAAGNLAEASRLLGRPYSVVGSVAASEDAPGTSIVTFAPPRSLPADGPWPAVLQPWPALPSSPAGIEAAVRVSGGAIVIDGPPPAGAVEITSAA